ncbi:plasma membrane permease, mediates uptake of glycerophosphoinositol and glycerophosphocholine [Aspergillus niger]|nr:plasma membrane permease, mediates uptake of glycerophosphoinositol and glycerophosphocholine [Aspergillus niger]
MSAENSWEVPQSKDAVDTSDAEPSAEVFRKRQSLSDFLTILASGFALISDGYEYNLIKQNAPCICHATTLGAKRLWSSPLMIVIGGILGAASHGVSINGMLWMLNVSRGIIGFGTGGEYPPSSVSTASENANDLTLKQRGPAFIMLTNFQLSFGGPFAVLVSLVVFSACQPSHYSTVQRVCFRFRVHLAPVRVLHPMAHAELDALSSRSHQEISSIWPDFITFPNGVFSATIISSVVDDDSVLKTGEWQLLLGAISLPCVSLGALLYNKLSGENIMMVGLAATSFWV